MHLRRSTRVMRGRCFRDLRDERRTNVRTSRVPVRMRRASRAVKGVGGCCKVTFAVLRSGYKVFGMESICDLRIGAIGPCGDDFRLLAQSLGGLGEAKCHIVLISNSEAETGHLTRSLESCSLDDFCDRRVRQRIGPKRVVMAYNCVTRKCRCPVLGFAIVSRSSVFNGGGGGGGEGACRKGGVRRFTRLGPKSCIMRRGRKLKVCRKVRGIRMSTIAQSCVGVSCTSKKVLCVPMARVSLVRGCTKTSTGPPGLGGLNAPR